MMKILNWLLPLSLFALVVSCDSGRKKAPDVSGIEVSVPIRRFEKDLFAIDTNDVAAGLAKLEAQYPEFGVIFFNDILGSKNPGIAPEGHVAHIHGFLTHPAIRELYDSCMLRNAVENFMRK